MTRERESIIPGTIVISKQAWQGIAKQARENDPRWLAGSVLYLMSEARRHACEAIELTSRTLGPAEAARLARKRRDAVLCLSIARQRCERLRSIGVLSRRATHASLTRIANSRLR